MYYERPKIEVSGDPKLCRHCGKTRKEHTGYFQDCCVGKFYTHFESKFDHDGTLNTSGNDCPVCPECGYEIKDWHEYFGHEEDARIECPECCKEFDVSIATSYSFSSQRIDHEYEAKKRDEEEQKRQLQREACKPFTPGTKVRIKSGDYNEQFVGQTGVVKDDGNQVCYVYVTINPDTTPRHLTFSPYDLEVI